MLSCVFAIASRVTIPTTQDEYTIPSAQLLKVADSVRQRQFIELLTSSSFQNQSLKATPVNLSKFIFQRSFCTDWEHEILFSILKPSFCHFEEPKYLHRCHILSLDTVSSTLLLSDFFAQRFFKIFCPALCTYFLTFFLILIICNM